LGSCDHILLGEGFNFLFTGSLMEPYSKEAPKKPRAPKTGNIALGKWKLKYARAINEKKKVKGKGFDGR